MSHKTPGIKHFTHLFPNTQIMQYQCDDIWRRVDQLNFRFGDELTSRPRRRDDQGDELTCNHPSHCLSCLVFSPVTRKRIAVFSQNFAGTFVRAPCHGGVLHSFCYWWNVVWIFEIFHVFFAFYATSISKI